MISFPKRSLRNGRWRRQWPPARCVDDCEAPASGDRIFHGLLHCALIYNTPGHHLRLCTSTTKA